MPRVLSIARAPGKWCLGHEVIGQAESLRTGHYVEGQYVDAVFSTRTEGRKAFASEPRCNLCRSIRRWHDHHANALRRARSFRGDHAERWVKLGRIETVDDALAMMDIGGVTDEALTEKILAALGEVCPGHCAYEQDGRIVQHIIDRVSEMHIDVRNPAEPLTLENIGILCISCNLAKGPETWATFAWKRRAQLLTWQQAIDNSGYRGSEQLGLFDRPAS